MITITREIDKYKPVHVIKAHQAMLRIKKKTCLPHVSYFWYYPHQGQECSLQDWTWGKINYAHSYHSFNFPQNLIEALNQMHQSKSK
jgi:hypothetical protein